MARILIAWELGDGLGHVGRLLPLARRLGELGHECVFALRDLGLAHDLVHDAGFALLQAPACCYAVPQHLASRPTGSLGDILAAVGFDDRRRLAPLVTAWADLLRLLSPELVISDYSPCLNLVAYGRYPLVLVGDGFTLPPSTWPAFPPFVDGDLRVAEADLVRETNAVLEPRGYPAISALPRVFRADLSFVVTLPELDPYAAVRPEPPVGPLEALPGPAQDEPETDYFAYLSMRYPGTRTVLEGLAALKLSGTIFLRDAAPEERASFWDRGLTIFDRPRDLRRTIPRGRILIHHGGLGTSEKGLAIGRAQLVVPSHFEQESNARMLGRLGVAVAFNVHFDQTHVARAWDILTTRLDFGERARRHAESLARRGPWRGLERVVEACVDLLEGRRPTAARA